VPQTEPAAAARTALPATTVSPPGLVATTCLTLGRETAALLKSPGIWLFGPLILLQVWGSPCSARAPSTPCCS